MLYKVQIFPVIRARNINTSMSQYFYHKDMLQSFTAAKLIDIYFILKTYQ